MRIRKHAKISPSIYAASSLKPGTVLQTHVCQLNQSPWDIMSFSSQSTSPPLVPPSLLQINGNDCFARNGSLRESVTAFESAASMKMDIDDRVAEKVEAIKWDYWDSGMSGAGLARGAANAVLKKDKVTVYCCKTDGKSWKCKSEAAVGNSLCGHHLSLARNYNHCTLPTSKKQDTVAAESPHRPRIKKAASKSLASNPYEFYYYSGFGPRWGKKRGENNYDRSNNRHPPENIEQEHKMAQSTASEIENEEFEDEYEEDEDDYVCKRKRARKPIKARSLKSLM